MQQSFAIVWKVAAVKSRCNLPCKRNDISKRFEISKITTYRSSNQVVFCRKRVRFISSEKSSHFQTLIILYHLKLKSISLRAALIALALFNDWKFGSALDLVTLWGYLFPKYSLIVLPFLLVSMAYISDMDIYRAYKTREC